MSAKKLEEEKASAKPQQNKLPLAICEVDALCCCACAYACYCHLVSNGADNKSGDRRSKHMNTYGTIELVANGGTYIVSTVVRTIGRYSSKRKALKTLLRISGGNAYRDVDGSYSSTEGATKGVFCSGWKCSYDCRT